MGLVLKEWDEIDGKLISDIQPEFIFCDKNIIPEHTTLDAIESKVVIYEVTEPNEAIHWFNRGADLVETFDFGGMMDALAHRTL